MSEPNYTERQRHLRNIVVMALADGSIGQREVEWVADRCVALGLGQDDLQSALAYGLGDDAALELPADEASREALLADLISMMAADGHLAESEKRLFALAAARMNIVGERLDQIITAVVSGRDSRGSKDNPA
ncbi:TerB family tellurite resistance protein [Allorhodopirellula heiligendammensis]|uniref:Tellurite resistance protein TerB n=1 Tax=Allorhodopirellula heiligendammensis TaxID=2714739 RepID=A0A5C6C9G8_9BACT|nr:TerB family tellurite resistance protein [Allorhodopirellula heiligendammensis]TWU19409.1 Tellurite resistance protein TerB [Allorhodopirellula heiligendammensis]|tara:strand:+ start:227 stop:622 length:396 start_codon:yes stop_codon:yes gene_type:complete